MAARLPPQSDETARIAAVMREVGREIEAMIAELEREGYGPIAPAPTVDELIRRVAVARAAMEKKS